MPAIPGCAAQGENLRKLIENVYDAVDGCLSVDMDTIKLDSSDEVMELAV